MSLPLLAARGVGRTYGGGGLSRTSTRIVLTEVDLAITQGECVALLGASGSGKSTLARLLLGLEPCDTGEIRFRGAAVRDFDRARMRGFRAAVQAVLQDPLSAVNPRHSIARSVAEPLRHLTDLSGPDQSARVARLLTAVGLDPAWGGRLPGQLSGGQVQRVGIARALATDPELVILDEAVSNLDVPLQIEILDHLATRRRDRGTAFLLITHDMRLARRFADRIAVMSEGRIVEEASARSSAPFLHPAALALAAATLPARPERNNAPAAQ